MTSSGADVEAGSSGAEIGPRKCSDFAALHQSEDRPTANFFADAITVRCLGTADLNHSTWDFRPVNRCELGGAAEREPQ
jgi:hypothetical protein